MAILAETFSTSSLKPLNEILPNWTGSKNSKFATKIVFFGNLENQDGRPGLWVAETFETCLKPLNGIWRNLTGSKNSRSSARLCFSGWLKKKNKMAPWLLICWYIFDFWGNSTGSKNVLYQVCVFHADWKNKMDALASDWLRHYQLLWNSWTEFAKTWQEARTQDPLSCLCFTGWSENKMSAITSHWLRHFGLFLWICWTEFDDTWQNAST